MTSSSDDLHTLDDEMNTFISQIEAGKAPNPEKLLKIENHLKTLLHNDKIPDDVKQKLQKALTELSGDPSGTLNLSSLFGAKSQIDDALGNNQL
ncbi:MAG: hypothetical protein K940chlam9_00616 [Chlamydiae bacterium]|nr:hypothetical protein [Chlamydiota bacterium]